MSKHKKRPPAKPRIEATYSFFNDAGDPICACCNGRIRSSVKYVCSYCSLTCCNGCLNWWNRTSSGGFDGRRAAPLCRRCEYGES